MTVGGWYPDPEGVPGRFRYWNGSQWSAATSDNPYAPPPAAGPMPYDSDPARPYDSDPARRRSIALIISGAAVVIVLAVIAAVAVRVISGRGQPIAGPTVPVPSISAVNDPSPLSTPTATPTTTSTPVSLPTSAPTSLPTSAPTSAPSPTGTGPTGAPASSPPPVGAMSCVGGEPKHRSRHPSGGRVYGGDLSFESPGWPESAAYAQQMTWAWDVDGVEILLQPDWAEMMADGSLHASDGFQTPEQSAEGMLECIASSAYYQGFTGRKDVFSKAVTVDGHPGWALRSQIFVDQPSDLTVPGDTAEVVVVDTGTQGQLSFFAGFVPIGDHARTEQLNQVIAGLKVG